MEVGVFLVVSTMRADTWELLRNLWPLITLQLVLMIWALVDLARRKTVRHLPKAAWVLIVLFVSTIGPIIYLATGRGEE